MAAEDLDRFKNLTYDGFRALARDSKLSPNERIGFPDSYREGKEQPIFEDLCAKLPNFAGRDGLVVDVGPGCAGLAFKVIDHCRKQGHQLVLIDSPEMLEQLPDEKFIQKVAGMFPGELNDFVNAHAGKVTSLISYSVLHYVFPESSVFDFVDASMKMLAPGGEVLVGDIPNVSMRKRFFASENGLRFHQRFTGSETRPPAEFNVLERGSIDDAALLGLLLRARCAGFDAWLLPQRSDLPMSNRREDLLIRRP
jgi:hypothetical protein